MHSLRLKLILGSLLVLVMVILSFSLFVYFAKRRSLLGVLDGRLFAEAQALAGHIELDSGRPVFEPAEEGDIQGGIPSAYRITDPQGTVIAQSTAIVPLVWPPGAPSRERPAWTTAGAERDGHWRVVTWSARIRDEQESADENKSRKDAFFMATFQCATPLKPIKEELGVLASQLALLGLATFLVAGGGSFILAGRALRPIRGINEALSDVSESRLDERLNPASFDKELHPLIGQLNAALDRLEKAFQRERQFTADVSHELRTPVAGILNTIEVLLRRQRTDRELREAHEDNLRIARSMQSMIEQLLFLARLDAGKGCPEKRPTRIAPLIEEAFANAEPEARKRKIQMSHNVDPPLRADVDPSQMRMALGNFIDNAVRYNRPNGSVTVGARISAEGLLIEVKDSGIGIPEEHLSLIFERFYRLDPSRTEGTGGCGLGLSIARRIIEAHGGRISAASGPDGSTFTVMIPTA